MDGSNTKDGKFIEDIKQIKSKRHALAIGSKPFSDKDFPTHIDIETLNDRAIHWKRIKELDPDPHLFNGGSALKGEMAQGMIENRPLIAVLSTIADNSKLMNYIFPSGQDFDGPSYSGLFYFRFWKMGKWVYVIVDDRLPVIGNKKSGEPKKKEKNKVKDSPLAVSSSKINDAVDSSKLVETTTDPPIVISETVKETEQISNQQNNARDKETDDVSREKKESSKFNGEQMQPNAMDEHKPIQNSEMPSPSQHPKDEEKHESEGNKAETKSSGSTTDKKNSTATVEEQKLPTAQTDNAKTNHHHDQISSKRISESVGKLSAGSKEINKHKQEDDDSENILNRKNNAIFVRWFGCDGKLYYWATLLEKACAKAHGGYNQLSKLSLTEIMLGLTGGVTEIFYSSYLPRGFFLDLKNYYDTRAIILAATNLPNKVDEQGEPGQDPSSSLLAVTSVIQADFRKSLGRDKIVGFVRLSNPYGEVKWIDPWKETSQDWMILPPLVTQKLQMISRKSGEFYLTYKNFLRAFTAVIICIVPDGENFNSEGYFGGWKQPKLQYNLCRIDDLRFHEFPQHKIWARDPNAEDTEVDVVISLVQNGTCCCSDTPFYNVMQLFLFCMDMERSHTLPLNFEFFRYNRPIGCSNVSLGKEVTARFKIMQGHYLVVPVIDYSKILHPCQANDYVLRVITPAKFPKPPPPPLSTFTNSENLNIYFDFAETIEEPKDMVDDPNKQSMKTDADKSGHKEKGKGRKKKIKH